MKHNIVYELIVEFAENDKKVIRTDIFRDENSAREMFHTIIDKAKNSNNWVSEAYNTIFKDYDVDVYIDDENPVEQWFYELKHKYNNAQLFNIYIYKKEIK